MSFLAAAAIGAAASLGSTWLSNRSAKKEAQRNRDFQQNMSDTAVSRRMQDLRNAGLNPLLAVDNASSGASTPAGSQAQLERFNPEWIVALSSAKVQKAQAEQIKEQTRGIKYENSMFEVKAEKMRLENEMQRQGILTEKTVQAMNSANTLESKARVLVHQANSEGIKMSTEEAKRKIQLLDLDVAVYRDNPDFKFYEKLSDMNSNPYKIGNNLANRVADVIVDSFRKLGSSARKVFENGKVEKVSRKIAKNRKNINEGKVRK